MHGPVSGGADVLLTDRLELRRWSEDDRRGWTELCRDPEVMRFIGAGVTWDADQIAAGFERNLLRWEQDGFGWRSIRVRDTGQWAGFVALNRLDAAATRMMRPGDLEIGWWLARSAWGRGYASEAAAAARAEAFGRLACTRLIARVRPENAASAKVAERLSMHLLGGDVGRSGEPILVYGLDRPR